MKTKTVNVPEVGDKIVIPLGYLSVKLPDRIGTIIEIEQSVAKISKNDRIVCKINIQDLEWNRRYQRWQFSRDRDEDEWNCY